MKTKKLLFILIIIGITASCTDTNTIKKDIKMYGQVWHEFINKRQIDSINDIYFAETSITVLSSENSGGVDDFNAYYKNLMVGLPDLEFNISKVFEQDENSAYDQDFMDDMVFKEQLGIASGSTNLTIIENLYKAFATGDMPTVVGHMDSNIIWNEAESNSLADCNPYIGSEAVLNGVFARIGGMYESFALHNIELHEMSYDKVFATLRYTLKVKATGKEVDVQAAHLWNLKDGKIIEFQQYVDTKKLAYAEK
ncbi:NTF2_like superfamily protein [Psychroflexus torquis ATCC 700755]|uniref:NTF2_like superfamily protein n=1 Tax=Psychroflexus torquis (strain ATCC 700755 / CIP 106069 / ACAM 623) TaxID=313595 RepID=K4IF65_PSYTT|nr:nuclear transport factor 2 family protein [Psychroflexus torquis]AFU69187.1 NTF2_like superfamily protein [Psychroflexus torquis ATCC 700755]